MQKKYAIITGAGGGVGKAVAKTLASDNFDVFLVDISATNLSSTADEIRRNFCGIHVDEFVCDVSVFSAVYKVVEKVIKTSAQIDVLFNNAGVLQLGTLDLSADAIEQLLRVNFLGAVYFMQAVAPYMKQQRFGHIINLASIAGKIGYAGYGAYGASKFALRGFSESVARELAPFNIKVSCFCPSYIDTPMARDVANCELPRETIITPEDISEIVRMLLKLSAGCFLKEIVLECSEDLV